MNQEEILKNLNSIFVDVFDDESIVLNKDTTADDIEEWDSLNQIRLIVEIENKFKLQLKPSDVNALGNIGEMIDHLHLLLN